MVQDFFAMGGGFPQLALTTLWHSFLHTLSAVSTLLKWEASSQPSNRRPNIFLLTVSLFQ